MSNEGAIAVLETLKDMGRSLCYSFIALALFNAILTMLVITVMIYCKNEICEKVDSVEQLTPEAAESAEESHE